MPYSPVQVIKGFQNSSLFAVLNPSCLEELGHSLPFLGDLSEFDNFNSENQVGKTFTLTHRPTSTQ